MRNFSSSALTDSNALSSSTPWLIFLEIDLASGTAYYVRNNEDITWHNTTNSITYTATDFNITAIPAKSTGELPEITLETINTASLVKDLEEHYGYIGTGVTVYYVHYASITSGAVTQDDWPLKFSFNVLKCDVTDTMAIFTFGIPEHIKRMFPGQKYRKDSCPYKYKGPYCWMGDDGTGQPRNVVTAKDTCNHLFEPYEEGDPNYYTDPGCKAHFLDLAEADRPHMTPTPGVTITYIPFGGFPSIGKGSYLYG